ncbi:MAG: accessory factor UbiK family protein [Chromatiales bacterium]
MDAKRIDELARRLAEALPEGITDLRTDMERNFRSVLQGTLARMDVVTREEFDVQAGVLARTRERVEQLLERLEELERGLQLPRPGKKNPPRSLTEARMARGRRL